MFSLFLTFLILRLCLFFGQEFLPLFLLDAFVLSEHLLYGPLELFLGCHLRVYIRNQNMVTRLKKRLQDILHVYILLKHDGNLVKMVLINLLNMLIAVETGFGVFSTVHFNSLLSFSYVAFFRMELIINSICLLIFGDNRGIHSLFKLMTYPQKIII